MEAILSVNPVLGRATSRSITLLHQHAWDSHAALNHYLSTDEVRGTTASVQGYQLPSASVPDRTSTFPTSVRGRQPPSASVPDATVESTRESRPQITVDLALPTPQKKGAKRSSATESTARPPDAKESSSTGTPYLASETSADIQIRDFAVDPFILRAHNPITTWDLERFVHGRCHLFITHIAFVGM